ncbi:hypothetical protein VCV18_006031 [Metarhizium anisopliae]
MRLLRSVIVAQLPWQHLEAIILLSRLGYNGEGNGDKQRSLKQQPDASKRYADHVKEDGFFSIDEVTQELRDH